MSFCFMQYVLGWVDLHFSDSLIDEMWVLASKQDKEDILSRFLVESEKDPETMNDQ